LGGFLPVVIRSFVFTTQGRLQSSNIEPASALALLKDPGLFLWVDLEKPDSQESKTVLEDLFQFHPLSIEDCIAPTPSPKVEEYIPREDDRFSNYLFIVVHTVDYNAREGVFATSELNLFLGANFVVTYHDAPLRGITQAEESAVKGTMHPPRAPDRLVHTLLDSIVENYKPALDEFSLRIAELEQRALESPDRDTLNRILQFKKRVVHLRQIIGPEQEVLARFARGEFKLIRPHLVPYFRDIYDSLFHISELARSYADSLTGTLQVYLNVSSNQTGEVVKLLTLITVITTPLMMIGTWYGMNFQHMPELSAKHSYAVAIGVMLVSTGATVWYFKKKKWF
jgi:magnesium transporter